MIVPISDRARRFGYFIWPKGADAEMRALLSDVDSMRVSFEGIDIGSKRIDWARRRISLGQSQTRRVPETAKNFVLEVNNGLIVTCR